MAIIRLTMGCLVAGPVRRFLDEICFEYEDLRYIETKDWMESHFVVKGPENKIRVLHGILQRHLDKLNND